VIDLHTHILAGLDDGAATIEDSIGMARAALADGITTLAATPHVREDYPTTADEMERGVAALRAALAAEGLGLQLVPGGEIALDRLETLDDSELGRFALGGGRYLLLEFPYRGWPLRLETWTQELYGRGFDVILAHPERNADATPERLRRLVEQGVLIQVTSASIDGRLGRNARTAAFKLLELELAHLIGSDAHAPELRAVGMRAAADALGDPALATWVTEEVPGAILAGGPVPTRPLARRRGLTRIFRN